MKIYIAIIEDRHCDILAYPFSTPEKAIDYVEKMAAEYWGTDLEKLAIRSWLYCVRCGENSAHVVEQELDGMSSVEIKTK